MSTGSDRREARRFNMALPLQIVSQGAKEPELPVHMRDVSYRGLYFLSDVNFEAGREIDFVITLPQQMTQSRDVKIRCQGQVVRVEPAEEGHLGVAAKIDRYEFVPSTSVV